MRFMKFDIWRLIAMSALVLGAVSTAYADAKIGVVFMHGKLAPAEKAHQGFRDFLERKGFLLNAPEMAWSKNRVFDKPYNEALIEIDAAVADLRARGATFVLVGGHSMGGNAALYYGTVRKVDGLFLLAPAHIPQSELFRNDFAESVARANAMVTSGKGTERAAFNDMELSGGGSYTVNTTAVSYLSYFDPESAANMELTVTKLAPGIPLLMVVSSKEHPDIRAIGDRVYAAIPGDKKKLLEVSAPHRQVPATSQEQVASWLDSFKSP